MVSHQSTTTSFCHVQQSQTDRNQRDLRQPHLPSAVQICIIQTSLRVYISRQMPSTRAQLQHDTSSLTHDLMPAYCWPVYSHQRLASKRSTAPSLLSALRRMHFFFVYHIMSNHDTHDSYTTQIDSSLADQFTAKQKVPCFLSKQTSALYFNSL